MPRHNQTGRSKGNGRFVQLHEYITRSYAWRRLSPLAKVAWLEIGFIYNGSNNGRIAVSARKLAERLDVGPSAAARALRELITWGFLDCMKASSFSQKKRAAEYRLTHFACDVTGQQASKRFMKIGAFDAVQVVRAAE
ncbi:MAG: hypothetical protein U1E20_09075 [Methylocystis sp.]|uniref:hypothetical protein n=1 Tax=Methylocystis sp. TaxID=1911079 RepID=UPI0039639881